MAQHYSDPTRENDPHALPNVETFYMTAAEIAEAEWVDGEDDPKAPGWYYWFCFPGCLPDGDPVGPFATEAEALEDARSGLED